MTGIDAVLSRDRSADGQLVYGVTSTGIYCRPSCPSRKPRPEHIVLFSSPAEAAAAGFRPCRRCEPDATAQEPISRRRVRRACAAVAARVDAPWTVAAIARAARASVPQVRRAFRAELGVSPRDYVLAMRRRRFLGELRKGRNVTDAMYDAGYGSSSRVYGALHLGAMTPATYGRGGQGATIDWSVVETRAGRVLVAATAKGLCFVEVGRDDASMLAALREEFPLATIAARPSPRMAVFARAAAAVADAAPFDPSLPVDVRATAFQWRVWQALTRIPRGSTMTYRALAESLGVPSAARAVARACATNPLALVVPCHRVVGSGGDLRGYRWGLDVKEQLIRVEAEKGRRKG